MFLNFEHQKRFIQWHGLLPHDLINHRDHLSLILLMSGNKELEEKISPYYDPENGKFAVDGMITKEDLSSDLEILTRLAVVVFNQRLTLNVHELSLLNSTNIELAIHVLRFRFQNPDLDQRLQHYRSKR